MLESMAVLAAGAIVNAAVIYGVIKTTLKHHAEGIARAEARADSAHERIDQIIILPGFRGAAG